MKIRIILTDANGENPLPNARLSLFLALTNGEERSLGPETADGKGRLQFTDIKPAFLRNVDFDKSRYRITHNGKLQKPRPLGPPERLANGNLRFVLKGQAPEQPQPEPDTRQERRAVVFLLRDTTAESPLPGAELSLELALQGEEPKAAGTRTADDSGVITIGDLDDARIESVDYDRSTFRINYGAQETKRLPMPKPREDDLGRLRFELVADGISAKDGGISLPPTGDNGIRKPQDGDWFVRGKVVDDDGNPLKGWTIRAHDKLLGASATDLGRAETGEHGRYELAYDPALFEKAGRKAPNLVIKLFRDVSQAEPVQVSGLIPKAGKNEKVDFATGVETQNGAREPSLFTQLEDDASGLVKPTDYATFDREDIALLSSEMGRHSVVVARFVRAFQLAIESDLPVAHRVTGAAAFFGWLSSGLPASMSGILARDDGSLKRLYREARERNLVPAISNEVVTQLLSILRETPAGGALTPLGQLIRAVGIDSDAGRVEAVILGELAEKDKWTRIHEIVARAKADRLELAIEMASIVEGDYALVAQMFDSGTATDKAGLVLLEKADLEALISKVGVIPGNIGGATPQARRRVYADFLIEKIELKLPHEHFLQRLKRDAGNETAGRVNAFLEREELRLDKPETLAPLRTSENDRELAELASLYQICPALGRAEAAIKLLGAGYSSSRDIVSDERLRFRGTVEALLPMGEPNRIYNRALHLESVGRVAELDKQAKPDPSSDVWAVKLFGRPEDSACEHCRSVLGPGAYLVDLVTYLKSAIHRSSADKTGQSLLLERQPHLADLQINCANAETPLPYIDLVLERLERLVPVDGGDGSPAPDSYLQTGKTAAELAAEPEHVFTGAYDSLMSRTFPWSLPFDRQARRTRSYLNQLGIPPAQVRRQLAGENPDALGAEEAAALLGIDGHAAISLGAQPKFAQNFGVQGKPKLARNATLDELALWLVIDADSLAQMMQSAFFLGGKSVPLQSTGAIDWEAIDNPQLAKLQFLGRLAVQTGLEVSLLDQFLTLPVVAQNVNGLWLRELAAVRELADRIGQKAETTTALFAGAAGGDPVAVGTALGVDGEAFAALAADAEPFLPSHALLAARSIERAGFHGIAAEDLLELTRADWVASDDETTLAAEALAALSAALLAVDFSGGAFEEKNPAPEIALALLAEAAELALAEHFTVVPEDFAAVLAFDDYEFVRRAAVTAGLDLAALEIGPVPEVDASLSEADLTRLEKQSRVMIAGEIAAADIPSLTELLTPAGWPDITSLPATATDPAIDPARLLDLLDHQQLHLKAAGSGASVFEILADEAGDISEIAAALGWSENDRARLEGLSLVDLLSKNHLTRMDAISVLASTARTDAAAIIAIVEDGDGDAARNLLHSALGDDEAFDVLKQCNDPLREQQRDALLACVIDTVTRGEKRQFSDGADIYAHYLFDPAVAPCFETSRIVQACSAAQQLVQRINQGLEPGYSFSPDEREQWGWRKNYRVWEANRKVFLFPENWIEPELRDNKTQLFEALEAELLQGEVTGERARTALMNYARGLFAISRMELVATLNDEETTTQYVFARTGDVPARYFMCDRGANTLWSGWREVDLEIDSDHILPVKFAGRLFLFWASATEHVDTENNVYRQTLTDLDVDEEMAREDINKYSRQVDDFTEKKQEYDELGGSGDLLAIHWRNLAELFEELIETAETNYQDAILRLESAKAAKSRLTLDFTYHRLALNWSELLATGQWAPTRRSAEEVDTIFYDDEGELMHERFLDRVWLRARHQDEVLAIELRARDRHTPDGREDLRIGKFEFDPLREAMRFTDNTTGDPMVYVNHFPTGMRKHQKLGFLHALPRLEVSTEGRQAELMAWDGFDITSVRQEEIAGYDPGQSPFIFTSEDRAFLVEPVEKVAPAQRTLKPLPKPAPRPITTALVASVDAQLAMTASSSAIRTPNLDPAGAARSMAVTPKPALTQPVTAGDWRVIDSVLDTATGAVIGPVTTDIGSRQSWRVVNFYHPFADTVVTELYFQGLDGLFRPDPTSGRSGANQLFRQSGSRDTFTQRLNPTPAVANPRPMEQFEFDRTQPYAIYNWELFFHAPFAIARHLTRNRQYEEAQTWLRYIFDPTRRGAGGKISAWWLGSFSKAEDESDKSVFEWAQDNPAAFEGEVETWASNPFNPHGIARLRPVSYMRATFFAYVENLIEWADDLFRRDSMESVNEAAQLYSEAASMLGRQPVDLGHLVPQPASNSLEEHLLGLLGPQPLLTSGVMPTDPGVDIKRNEIFALGADDGLGDDFEAFCVPGNDRLHEYWNTISDRLFKIRHCRNIDGVERILALFQPPIDPAMLVRAAAAGIDIGAAMTGLSAPRPIYRFTYMLEKARQFAASVRELGTALLGAIEKGDAEELGVLRADHEVAMRQRMRDIRKSQIAEAEASLAAIERAIDSAANTYNHWEAQISVGKLQPEKDEQRMLDEADAQSQKADWANVTGSVLAAIPQIGWNGPLPKFDWGGVNAGQMLLALGAYHSSRAGGFNRLAGKAARNAVDMRRHIEWSYQRDAAEHELKRLDKEKLSAEIRLAMAERELENLERQIEESQETARFLSSKFSNADLYGWMTGQLSQLHYQSFKLAQDLARQAEACMRFELDEEVEETFVGAGHWNSARKGLSAGHALSQDLRRMEAHYLARNSRAAELSKSISLVRLSPDKLLDLRRTGSCIFDLPAVLFDLDQPGHYRRRIKSVSLTIMAVAGPHASVGARLELLDSYVEKLSGAGDVNVEPQSIRTGISTSSAQDDAGLFQLDFRDERYLPFEGAGVISRWKLQLPHPDIAQFNYNTIADVVMHMRYTSRYDASRRQTVEADLSQALGAFDTILVETADDESGTLPSPQFRQLLSLRYDFPAEWARLAAGDAGPVRLSFGAEHFGYLPAKRGVKIVSIELFEKPLHGTNQSATAEYRAEYENVDIGEMEVPIPDNISDPVGNDIADYDVIVTFQLQGGST